MNVTVNAGSVARVGAFTVAVADGFTVADSVRAVCVVVGLELGGGL